MNRFVLWTLLFLAAELLVSLLPFLLRKKRLRPWLRGLFILGKALLDVVFAFLPMAGPVQLRPVQPLLIALYAALLSDAAADLVYSLFCALRKRERRAGTARLLGLAFGLLFFVYGTVNMQLVRPCRHELCSDKLTASHKIVFVADVHAGSAQDFSTLEKAVADMAAEQPEAIILGGDITDDYTRREEMEAVCRLFGGLDVPVYYVYGNHDRQGHAEYAGGRQYSEAELEQALLDSGIIVLKDAYVPLGEELLLLGREDLSAGEGRADIASLPNPAPEKFLLVADHQPNAFRENLAAGADLQLSGHTHAGQLFPLRAVYSLAGYTCGEYAEEGALLIVSAGESGWRVPFRTEARCCYEVVTLVPAG